MKCIVNIQRTDCSLVSSSYHSIVLMSGSSASQYPNVTFFLYWWSFHHNGDHQCFL